MRFNGFREARMGRMSRRAVLKAAAAGAAGLAGVLRRPLAKTVVASDLYSSVVLAKGPVGYWRLGEAGGPNAFDATGNGYDGSYLGNPTFGQAGAILNDPDTAILLNGPDSRDYIEILDPDSEAFSQPTSGMGLTVEVWMRPDVLTFPGQTSERYIHWLGKCVSGSGQCEWGLRFYSQDSPSRPNRISAYIWNPDGGEGAGAYFQDDLTPGQWIHVVAVYEPGDKDTVPPAGVNIYRDGVHRQGPSSSGTLYKTYSIVPVHGTLPLRFGTRDAAAFGSAAVSYLTGGLDEIAIYPRVLTSDEILENYCTGSEQC
jgi:concanavalin A-like lectin/glucanase superfamily protein